MHFGKRVSFADLLSQTWAVRPSPHAQDQLKNSKFNSDDQPPLPALPENSDTEQDDKQGALRSPRIGKPSRAAAKQRTTTRKPTFKWIRGDMIGKGSYGKVYMALNATTGEIMAVKQVELPQTASDRMKSQQYDVVEALRFESATLKDLNHPNIVSYLGIEESPEHLSIFLEYVPGGTIGQCLRKHGRFRESVTKSFTGQILNGLHYLHQKGIIHRDLKAENILLEPAGICKISDFGISKKAEDMTRGRAFTGMKGTVFWMAPEILDSKGNGYDLKVDIWSLGCVVLEMWSGVRPWYGEQIYPVMYKLCDRKTPPVPPDVELSESAAHFMRECFHVDPQLRPSASLLRKHPYLELPPNWTFRFLDMASTTKNFRSLSISSKKSRRPSRARAHPLPENVPPLPLSRNIAKAQVKTHPTGQSENPELLENHSLSESGRSIPVDESTNVSTIKPPTLKTVSRPALTTLTIPEAPPEAPVVDGRLMISPQVVFIERPSSSSGSAARSAAVTQQTSNSDLSEGRKKTRRRRRLRVCNPDSEEEVMPMSSASNSFKYIPPPLPELLPNALTSDVRSESYLYQDKSPMSSGKSSPSLPTFNEFVDTNNQNSSRSSTSSASSYSSSSHRPHLTPTARSTEALKSASFKSPTADVAENTPLSNSTAFASRHLQSLAPKSMEMDKKDDEWQPRPHIEDVVGRLEDFFPNDILDQAIEDPASTVLAVDQGVNRRRKVKSIRKLALEQYDRRPSDSRFSRRNTMLWDSRLEELKT